MQNSVVGLRDVAAAAVPEEVGFDVAVVAGAVGRMYFVVLVEVM
jgi:hypothetical protein